MTAKQIQKRLFIDTKPYVAAPNIFMYGKYESDLLTITKALFAHEYEIKLSKSDFFADFKKSHKFFIGSETITRQDGMKETKYNYGNRTKHEMYLNGKGPNRFSYVFPDGLIEHDKVPDWCGIVVIRNVHGYDRAVVVRAAKLLHKNKATEKQILQIARSLSFKIALQ
jgi:hypothetical protein